MFESIKSVLEILTDKSKSLGFRTAIFISTIGLLIIVDLIFNFTFDIHISNKLNNLEKIYQLKQIYKKDSMELERLNVLEKRIIERKHYSEYLPFYDYSKKMEPRVTEIIEVKTTQRIHNIPINLNKNDSIQIEKLLKLREYRTETKNYNDYLLFFDSLITSRQVVTEKIENKTIKQTAQHIAVKERSRLWMFISSNAFFMLISFFMLFVPIFNKDQPLGTLLIGIFASIVILSGIMLTAYWTSYLIPLLFNRPILNYILNFLIHLFFIIVSTKLIIKASKKSK